MSLLVNLDVSNSSCDEGRISGLARCNWNCFHGQQPLVSVRRDVVKYVPDMSYTTVECESPCNLDTCS